MHAGNPLLGLSIGLFLCSSASAQLSFTTSLPGTFIDISTTGTPLSLGDDAEVNITTTVGNALFGAGVVRVGSNGGVRFDGLGSELAFVNATIPSTAAFLDGQCLLPFWDDFDTDGGQDGEIYWEEVGGVLIIQWQEAAFYPGGGDTATLQVQVPSTGSTWARFLYQDIEQARADGGASATIGYQSGANWGNDSQFSFNTPGAVANGDVVSLIGSFTPPPPPPMGPVLTITDTLPGTYLDISMTGTALSLSDDGEVDVNTTVGNAVFPAGVVRVGSNGGIRFLGTSLELAFTNAELPSTFGFGGDQTLFPFWDDIDTDSGLDGEIYYQEVGGDLIIQWQDAAFFPGGGDTATFQVQVHSSGPVLAQFLYLDIQQARPGGGASATIGYHDIPGGTFTEWSFNTLGAVADGDVLSFLGDSVGSRYCSPAVPNTTGQPGTIDASGSSVAASNQLTLTASSLPANQFGIFIVSPAAGFLPSPGGSSGILCLSGGIGRYNGPGQLGNSGASGAFSLMLNLTATPSPTGPFSVQSGQTLYFQAWYRDFVTGQGATSNFTDALQVDFL